MNEQNSAASTMTLDELQEKIREWAAARNLIKGSDPLTQFCKLASELGELGDNIAKNNAEGIKDDIGDCAVVATIIAAQLGLAVTDWGFGDTMDESPKEIFVYVMSSNGELGNNLREGSSHNMALRRIEDVVDGLSAMAAYYDFTLAECVSFAYNEIKDRKGVMYNGTFIKESDARYSAAVEALASV